MHAEHGYTVRALTPDDTGLFASLMTLFGEVFDEPDTYTGKRPSADYVADLLGGDRFIALVALDSDQVIGGLASYVLPKFEQQRSEIYIYDLAVAEAHRRRGVATMLIEALKPIAVERGVWVIYVQADQGDTPAIELYSKLGSREEVLHFDIEPEADSGRATESGPA